MEHRVRVNWLGAALVVALGIAVSAITSTVVASRAYRARVDQASQQARSITVKGSTRKRISADRATWQIHVTGEAATLTEAYDALESGVSKSRKFLTDHGFGDADIGLGSISTSTHYARDKDGRETREVAAYSLFRSFFVSTADVTRVSRTAGIITELIRDGVTVSSSPPEYTFTKMPELRIELMGAASKDARARAETIAGSAGCAIDDVRYAHMGVMQVTRPDSMDFSDSGSYDTSSIDKDVTAVVTLTFGVRGL